MNNVRKKGALVVLVILVSVFFVYLINRETDEFEELYDEYQKEFIVLSNEIVDSDPLDAIKILNFKVNRERIESLVDISKVMESNVNYENELEYKIIVRDMSDLIKIMNVEYDKCREDKKKISEISFDIFTINMSREIYIKNQK